MKRLHRLSPLFFLSLIVIGLLSTFMVASVKATSYYEWVQNGGFEDCGGNALADAGFESGGFSAGWTLGGWGYISSGIAYSGSYAYHTETGKYCYTYQDLDSPIAVESVTEFSFWIYKTLNNGNGYANLKISITYNDTTSDYFYPAAATNGTWYAIDALSELSAGKFITRVLIASDGDHTPLTNGYIDDIVLGTIDTGGQTDFDVDTEPWWAAQDYTYQYVNTAFGHNSFCSASIGYTDYNAPIIQEIPMLDSDTVYNATCWVHADSATAVHAKIEVVYSDRTSTSLISGDLGDDTWHEIDFSSIIIPNKVIRQILLLTTDATGTYVHFDDVSIFSTVPYGQGVFNFDLTPSALAQTNHTFSAYQGVAYVFTGYVYDSAGVCNATGTYSAVHNKGTSSGTINGGVFSFTITERTGVMDFVEQFTINIISDTQNFTIGIAGTWVYTGYATPPAGDGSYGDWYSNMIVSFMVFFIFIIVPPLIIAVEMRNRINPAISFVVGLILTTGIGYMSGIVPLWFVFMIVILIAVIFLELLHGRGYL